MITFSKSDDTPEGERPPGSDWEYQYTLITTLGPRQRLIDATIVDTLDSKWQFTGLDSIVGSCDFTQSDAPTLPDVPPPEVGGGVIVVDFSEIDNSSDSPCSVVITYSGYILDILTEDDVTDPAESSIVNLATFDSSWTGNDDTETNALSQLTATDTVLVDNMVFQKGVSPESVIPGVIVNYTINYQITQFNSIVSVLVTDTVPNGISPDYDSYEVELAGTTYPIPNSDVSRTINPDGTITVIFNLIEATGIPLPLPGSGSGQIRYDGTVDIYYRDSLGNDDVDEPIRASDSMTNTVLGEFELSEGATQSNTSSATVNVPPVSIEKETLSSVNPPENAAGYAHGEDVTFRLTMEIPSGDTQGIVFQDFFPLPVFVIDDADLGLELPAGSGPFALPIQNTTNACYQQFNNGDNDFNCGIAFGPDSTIFPLIESVSLDATTNSIEISFEDINTGGPQILQIDVTVAIIDNPFSNGLYLSNQFSAEVKNTPGAVQQFETVSYLNLNAPELEIVKGVVDSSSTSVMIDPAPESGIVNAGSDGDATEFDANDTVTYSITVANIGGASAYNVAIDDDTNALAGLENCTLDTVTSPSGAPLAYTGGLPSITLTEAIDIGASAVVRLTCDITNTVNPNQTIINTATANYNGLPVGGYVFDTEPIPYPEVSDTATITTRDVSIIKSVTPISATIGETVTYSLQVNLPAGVINNAQIEDVLPSGLAFIECVDIVSSGSTAIITDLTGGFTSICDDPINPTVSTDGTITNYSLGNISVDSPSDTADERILTLTYTAVVLDVVGNIGFGGSNTDLINTATLSSNDTDDKTAQATVTVVEPDIEVVKIAVSGTGDAGDIVEFTISMINNGDSTAYDLVLIDVIPLGMTFLDGSYSGSDFSVTGITPISTSYTSGTRTLQAQWDSIAVADVATLSYRVTLDAGVESEQFLINNVNLTYDSRMEDDLSDISPYVTPEDRERDYTKNTNIPVPIVPFLLNKEIINTSETQAYDTSDNNVSIGERIAYSVTIDVPEGIHNNVVLIDTLDNGLAFTDLTSTGGIASLNLNGVISSRTVTQILNDASASVGSSGQVATFDFGNLTNNLNLTDGIDRTTMTLTYEVVVLDSVSNTRGSLHNNAVNLTYDNGGNLNANAPDVTIVEPELQILKTANPTDADAGDLITFTLEISHIISSSNATAFDIQLEDVIPIGLSYVPASLQHTGGIAPNTGTLLESAGTITAEWDRLTTSQTSTIEFQTTIDNNISASSSLINIASLNNYDTLDADDITDGLSIYIASTDDRERTYSDSDDAEINITDLNITKAISTTSESDTSGTDVAIGERITYIVQFGVPEGITNNVVITDTLDTGLAFVDLSTASITFPTNVSSSRVNSAILSDASTSVGVCNGGGCAVTFDFGTMTSGNTQNGINLPNVEIEYEVVVLDIVSNTRGTVRGNAVALDYDSAPSGGILPDTTPTVTIVEPEMRILKTASPTTGDAGDIITFTLIVENLDPPANASAYDIVLDDVIPTGMTYVPASLSHTSGIAPDSGSLTIISGTIAAQWAEFIPSDTSTLTFQTILNTTTELNQLLTNTAILTDFDTLDADDVTDLSVYVNDGGDSERDYTENDSADVLLISANTITKSVSSTDHDATDDSGDNQHNLAIGEEVSYELQVRFREGTSNNVIIEDVFPAGVIFDVISASVTEVGANISGVVSGTMPSGDGSVSSPLTWLFATVTNSPDNIDNTDDEIVIVVNLRVDDNIANDGTGTNDKDQQNTATITYDDDNNTPVDDTDTATIDLVEPDLLLNKTRLTGVSSTEFDAGDIIGYRLTIDHTASSTANAYDVVISDILPTSTISFLGVVSGSTTCSNLNTSFTSPTVTFIVPLLTLANDSCDIVYSVSVSTDIEPSSTYTNTADATYTTLPDDPTDDRTKSTNTDTASFITPNLLITKAISTTNQTSTSGTNVAIGEQVTYRVSIGVPEGITNNVVLTDTLDMGLTFVDINSATITFPTGVSSSRSTPTILSDANSSIGNCNGGGCSVTFDLGIVTNVNITDGVTHPQIFVDYDVLVMDIVSNTRGTIRNNSALLSYDNVPNGGITPPSIPQVTIVEPQLELLKTVTPTVGDAGDVITILLAISNSSPSSDATAFDVVLEDVLPTGMTYVPASLIHTSGVAPDLLTSISGTVSANWSQLTPTEFSTITFQVTLDSDVASSSIITNIANINDYDTLDIDDASNLSIYIDDGTDSERSYTETDSAAVDIVDLIFAKAISTTSQSATSGTDVAIGERVTYRLTVGIPGGVTTNAEITDTLEAGLAFTDLTNASITFPSGVSSTRSITTILIDASASIGNCNGGGCSANFDFGSITNTNIQNGINRPTIIIEYDVVVLDIPSNIRGIDRGNSVALIYDNVPNGAIVPTSPPEVNIVEPSLLILKNLSPTIGDVGDVITFTLTIAHDDPPSDASAFDVVFEDVLPAGLTYVPSSLTHISGVVPEVGSLTLVSGTINARWSELVPSDISVLTFDVVIDENAIANSTITNTAEITDYDTLDTDDASDLSLYVDDSTDRERDYTADDSADLDIVDLTISKSISSTSEIQTLDNFVAIGERIKYSVEVGIPEGIAENVVVVDILDAGLAYVDLSNTVITIPTNISSSRTLAAIISDADSSIATCNGGRCSATFNFGTLENIGTTNIIDRAPILIEYDVVVLDIVSNTQGTTRNNIAGVTYDTAPSGIFDTSPNVTIVEPSLVVSKVATPSEGAAGSVITFTLDLFHTNPISGTSAFDIVLRDVIPDGMTYVPSSISHTDGVAPDIGSLSVISGTINAVWAELTPLQTSELTFQVTLDADVVTDSTIINQVILSDYDTLEADDASDLSVYVDDDLDRERSYVRSSSTGVDIINLTIAKAITSTSESDTLVNNVAIGERVTYQIAVGKPSGVTNNATIVDTLDVGMAFVDLTTASITFPTNISSSRATSAILSDASTSVSNCNSGGCSAIFDFGTIINNNSAQVDSLPEIIIEYDVVILDIVSNTRGTVRDNAVVLNYENAPVGGISATNPPQVTIVEPQLQIMKSSSPTAGDAGDLITFTLVISHVDPPSDATAYDVVITDVIPDGMTYVASSVTHTSGIAPDIGTLTSISGTINARWAELTPTQSSTLTFQVTLDADVIASSTITNDAIVSNYDTLDADDVDNLSIYVDDNLDRERSYTTSDSSTVDIVDLFVTKIISSTSESATTGTNVAIGERVSYQVTIGVPEGVTDNVLITDTLDTGMAFVDLNVANISIPANITSTRTTSTILTDADASITDCNTGGCTAIFNLGTLTNNNSTDGVNRPIIIIDYDVVVLDIISNTRGTVRDNNVLLTYDTVPNGGLAPLTPPEVTLVEPQLQILKTVSPTSGDAEDIVTFTLEISHVNPPSDASAFDVVLEDIIPNGITYSAGTLSHVSGVAPDSGSLTVVSGTINARWAELSPTQLSILTFQTTIDDDTELNQVITNTASLTDYDTLEDDNVIDLSNYVDDNSDTERDYSDADSVDVTLTGTNIILKSVISTSHSGTDAIADGEEDITVGELVTYEMRVTFREGTSTNVVVTDTFPSAVVFDVISATITEVGANISGIVSGTAPTGNGSVGNPLTWSFPSVVNTPDNLNNSDDEVVFLITLRMDNSIFNEGRGNTDKDLANIGKIEYDNANNITVSNQDTAIVDLVEPDLRLTKTRLTGNTSSVFDAGDTIAYRLRIDHSTVSTANAYDIQITDILPMDAINFLGIVSGTTTCSNLTSNFSIPSLTLTIPVLTLADNSCDVVYEVILKDNIESSRTYTNRASGNYSSLPDTPTDDRTKPTNNATATFDTPDLLITKSISTTSETPTIGTEVAIGERITYRITVDIPEGESNNVIVRDILDRGLSFVDMTTATITYPTNISPSRSTASILIDADASVTNCNTGGCLADFEFGTITNNNVLEGVNRSTIIIEYEVIVLNIDSNIRGVSRGNSAVLSYDNVDGGGVVPIAPPDVTIVEPELSINKTINPTSGNAGDVLTVTIVIAGVEPPSDTTAFDIVLQDTIPSGMTYIPSSITHTTGVPPNIGSLTESSGVISAIWDSFEPSESSTVTFGVTLDDSTELSESITNTAYLTYDTLSTDDASDLSQYVTNTADSERDYTDDDDAVVSIIGTSTILKSVSSTSESGTDASGDNQHDLAIGEEVTYSFQVNFREGTSDNVVIQDVFPTGVRFDIISATVTEVGTNISGVIIGDSATGIGTALNPLRWTFPIVVNTADNVDDINDQVIFSVVLRVDDIVNNNGLANNDKNQTNTVSLRYENINGNTQTDTDTATIDLVEPELSLEKERLTGVSSTEFEAGDTIRYQITLSHTVSSTTNAYDIDITDTLPTDDTTLLQVVSGATTCSGVTTSYTSPILTLTVPELPLSSTACDVVYDITVGDDVQPNSSYTNTALAIYTTLSGTGVDDRSKSTDTDTDTFITTSPTVTKVVSSTNLADTISGTDSDADLTIGEEVTYTLTLTLPEGVTNNVRITDTLPSTNISVEYVSSQIASIGAGITLDSGAVGVSGTYTSGIETVSWAPGTITNPAGGGNSITFEIIVRINDIAENVGLDGIQDMDAINSVELIYEDQDANDLTLSDSESIDLVEPELILTKTRLTGVSSTEFEAGDTIQYQITLLHTASSTANAYDVDITDSLPTTGMGFLQIVSGTTTCTTVTSNYSAPNVSILVPVISIVESSCNIVYEVIVGVDVEPLSTYTNTVQASYSYAWHTR